MPPGYILDSWHYSDPKQLTMTAVVRQTSEKETGLMMDLLTLPFGKAVARSKSFNQQNTPSHDDKLQGSKLSRSNSCFGSLVSSNIIADGQLKSEPLSADNNGVARGIERRRMSDGCIGQARNLLCKQRSRSALDLTRLSELSAPSCQPRLDSYPLSADTPADNDSIADMLVTQLQEFRQRRQHGYHDYDTCCICYEDRMELMKVLMCTNCHQHFCFECLREYVESQVQMGCIQITCPEMGCGKVYSGAEVELHSTDALMTIYHKNHAEATSNPRVKACPGCNTLLRIDPGAPIPKRVTCSKCSLAWCFACHAPWHVNMTCKAYADDVQGEGRRALRVWAKSKGKSVKNARKCPKCKFFIERIAGCDHMTCSRCFTGFCYSCGKRFYSLGILGSHYSRFSFLGCKYNLSPTRPIRRIAIRTACTAALSLVALGIVAVSPIVLPVAAVLYCKRRY